MVVHLKAKSLTTIVVLYKKKVKSLTTIVVLYKKKAKSLTAIIVRLIAKRLTASVVCLNSPMNVIKSL